MRIKSPARRGPALLTAFGFLAAAVLAAASGCEAESADDGADTSDDPGNDTSGDDGPVPAGDGGPAFSVEFYGEGVACGDERCQDARIPEYSLDAKGCCVEETTRCGLNLELLGLFLGLSEPGCEELNAPGSVDDSCAESEPIYSPTVPEAVVLDGCCRANGTCGFMADFGGVGFGCVDPQKFDQESSGSCDYEP